MERTLAVLLAALLAVVHAPPAHADVLISEFLALNESTLADADGDFSDWMEISNTGAAAVDLEGWSLTDDPFWMGQWRFPALRLEPGGCIVVFASGKNRADPASELHTNFRLAGEGEYLGLFRADGTLAHDYAPAYPRQRADISHGLATEGTTLLDEGAPGQYVVPADGSLGTSWTLPAFVPDGRWRGATTGIGFDAGGPLAPRGLVSHWSLDGHLLDDAGPNDGVFAGGGLPLFVPGHDGTPGGAVRLDGVNDYIRIAGSNDLPIYNHPAFSVSLWVRGLPQADRRVFSEGSGTNRTPVFNIGVDVSGNTGAVDIFIRDENGAQLRGHTQSRGIAFDGTWHHIAWTDDGGDAALYIDGVRDPVDFIYGKKTLPLDRTSIGAILRSDDSFHFDGDIDGVSLWSRVLEPGEIAHLAAGGSPLALSSRSALVATDIGAEMAGTNASVHIRLPFRVDDPTTLGSLALGMRYDDGFIAYLNGVEVARRNAPAGPSWNATATRERTDEDAVVEEMIPLTAHLDALVAGENVLALHGLNSAVDDPDFLLLPRLLASSRPAVPRFFATPSPCAPNTGGVLGFVADTVFSHDRGHYNAPFEVKITSATPGAEIRYTLDGSAPAAGVGEVYGGPIPVTGTTILRAAAFREGYEPSNVDSQTYIFLADVYRQTRPAGYATTWGGIAADYDMDREIVDAAGIRDRLGEALLSLPSLSLVLDVDDLFGTRGIYQNPGQTGRGSERPASMEFFDEDGDIQVTCGLRPFGNTSRSLSNTPKQGFRLVFRGEYGPRKLRFRVFPDSPVERFDTIVLRANYPDSWLDPSSGNRAGAQYVRDQWVREIERDMGGPAVHGRFVHLFLNGLYWGVYNITERPDASFGASHLGGEKEQYDAVKNHEELVDGTLAAYDRFDALARGDLRSQAAYDEIRGLVDVDNLADYMILNMYAPAVDWPGNYYMLRRREPGAGFHFLCWDSDKLFFEGLNIDRTRPHRRDADSPTKFHHALRVNEEYRVTFGDHVHRHFFNGGLLTADSVIRSWRSMSEGIEFALLLESARWGDYRRSRPYVPEEEWLATRRNFLESFFPRRSQIVLDQFRCTSGWAGCTPLYPDVAAPVFNRHGGRIEPGFEVVITTAAGDVYYTLDGTDPRLPGGAIALTARLDGAPVSTVLLPSGAAARALVPSDGNLGLRWTAVDFDDAGWAAGGTGVGYERTTGFEDLIGLDVRDAMDGVNGSVYLRVPFRVESPGDVRTLVLAMKYDDGFIAYLNGLEVARRNAPAPPRWDSTATAPHTDAAAVVFETIDISEHAGALGAGGNVLAIHGLNASASSSDLLILPELRAGAGKEEPILLDRTTTVRARSLTGGEWSALNEATFVLDTPLRITELMYHPRDPGPDSAFRADDFEFVELQNIGDAALDLTGITIAGAIAFHFDASPVRTLGPGEIVVIVREPLAFSERHDTSTPRIAGRYDGRLRNSGEALRLTDAGGHVILDFAYDDLWYPETDGAGHSLVIRDRLADPSAWGDAASWRPSRDIDGSPGIDEDAPPPARGRLPGDANQDGSLDLSDPIRLLVHLYVDATIPPPCDGAITAGGNRTLLDANGDGTVNISDPIHLLRYLFSGGPPHVRGTRCVSIPGCPVACR